MKVLHQKPLGESRAELFLSLVTAAREGYEAPGHEVLDDIVKRWTFQMVLEIRAKIQLWAGQAP